MIVGERVPSSKTCFCFLCFKEVVATKVTFGINFIDYQFNSETPDLGSIFLGDFQGRNVQPAERS